MRPNFFWLLNSSTLKHCHYSSPHAPWSPLASASLLWPPLPSLASPGLPCPLWPPLASPGLPSSFVQSPDTFSVSVTFGICNFFKRLRQSYLRAFWEASQRALQVSQRALRRLRGPRGDERTKERTNGISPHSTGLRRLPEPLPEKRIKRNILNYLFTKSSKNLLLLF